MKTVVVVPTYNEAEGIVTLLDAVLREAPDVDVLVVDDNSPDGTAARVAGTPHFQHRVHLLSRREKDGLGRRLPRRVRWALAGSYDAIVQMDADLSHPPERLPALLGALEHADVAIGSRYVRGGGVRDWPLRRRADLLGRQRLRPAGPRASRSTTRPRASRPSAARRSSRSGRSHSESNGYCFQIENTWRASRLGLRITEVPITFTRPHARRVEDVRRHRPRGDAAGADLALARDHARGRPRRTVGSHHDVAA